MRASIIVLTYNQLEDGTRPCIESIFRFTDSREFELIIVDNASSDGTQEYLRSVRAAHENVILVLNDKNKGYAAGNNDGIKVAKGESLILLNNDTMVTPNWLDDLLVDIEGDPTIGLIGPVTNSAGNEQMILIPSLNLENHVELARQYVLRHKGYSFETQKLGFFCVAIRKDVIGRIGLLDEKFGLGMFEDDDYCLRARKAGYRLMVKEGCFIYHKGSLTFKKIINKEYQELFDRNRAYFVSKHGTDWLFNDLTMAFYRQMAIEVRRMEASGQRDQAGLERISVRLNGFKYLIENAMELEKRSGPSANTLKAGDHRIRRAMNVFSQEFLHGDRRSRRRFIRKVKRRYRPLTKEKIIQTMGSLRREERFDEVIVFPAAADYGDGKGEAAKLAREMAKEGQLVVYGTLNRERDNVEICSKVLDHLYLMNQDLFPFLPHMATSDETVLYVRGPGDIPMAQLLRPRRIIAEVGANGTPCIDNADVLVRRSDAITAEAGDVKIVRIVEGQERKAALDIIAALKG